MPWTRQLGVAPRDAGDAWQEFVEKAELAWCRVLDFGPADQASHCGRGNSVRLTTVSAQARIRQDLPAAFTEKALHWRRLRKAVAELVGAVRRRHAAGLAWALDGLPASTRPLSAAWTASVSWLGRLGTLPRQGPRLLGSLLL